ncbi:MAG: hypothetical protein NT004_17030 [Bacteroidetes bacterium]|nr:hypothetical protein [Bacteroidota bacterium]
MKIMNETLPNRVILTNILVDLAALALIYFIPATVHFTGIPIYMIEPMRLMLILSMAHTSKSNSYFLALTLPLFSFLVSGHPELIKMFIITGELVLNTLLFYWLVKKFNHTFFAMFVSIITSKIACYLAYWPVFSIGFVVAEASPDFILIQLITSLIFSFYIAVILKKKIL